MRAVVGRNKNIMTIKMSPFWKFENNNLCCLSVSAGSRVSKELRYTKEKQGEESVFTSQMLIQTPKQEGTNILTQEALLLHLEAALSASKVQVSLYGKWVQPPAGLQGISSTYKHEDQSLICSCTTSTHRSWDLNKICFKSGVPIIENVMIERVSMFLLCNFWLAS